MKRPELKILMLLITSILSQCKKRRVAMLIYIEQDLRRIWSVMPLTNKLELEVGVRLCSIQVYLFSSNIIFNFLENGSPLTKYGLPIMYQHLISFYEPRQPFSILKLSNHHLPVSLLSYKGIILFCIH
jgi:hypothetical protein